jgi:hypothetical protein
MNVDILDPQVGDTHVVGDVTFRVKSVVQDSVEYEIIEGKADSAKLESLFQIMAQEWFNALPPLNQFLMQNPNGGKFNVKANTNVKGDSNAMES